MLLIFTYYNLIQYIIIYLKNRKMGKKIKNDKN
jgi:hypothetical protein